MPKKITLAEVEVLLRQLSTEPTDPRMKARLLAMYRLWWVLEMVNDQK